MTLKELSQLYWLNKEIDQDKKRLKNKGKTPAEIETIIKVKKERCVDEQIKLEKYIASIKKSKIRLIFTLRFVEGLSWDEVAAKSEMDITGKSCSNVCYRYLKKIKKNEENSKTRTMRNFYR